LMVAALAAMGAGAAPVVEITSVQQQYPWTNTVDITYTSTGIAEANTYYVVFKAQDSAGKEIGVITNDLKVSQGSTWVAQWQPPFNVRYENCTMTPYVYKGGMDDYMVIDLATWQVTYEPMSTQEASNKKYNTDEYKTNKLVLRKIEAGDYWIGGPETGMIYEGTNSYHKCNIPKPYYIGVFDLTNAQWNRIVNGTDTGNTKPVVNVSYNTLRGSAGTGARPSTGLFAILNANVTNPSGAKLVNLESSVVKNDSTIGFDLPTESMWEIAARAGDTHMYPSGDTYSGIEDYAWNRVNSGNAVQIVGLKPANAWGLYDMVGNVYENMRDVCNPGDLAELQPNGLVPITQGNAASSAERTAGYNRGQAGDDRIVLFRYSARHCTGLAKSSSWGTVGQRVAYIPE
ncbi:MAG: SUMF1/EgtB/PvdO family nonheme iron enzyme, partial [Kiritimatiellae bacterium]|nr:SUMF1/EgtB/PvdO family nonheme iron enzyme [Kiritimatiellia bacterium]